MRHEKSTDNLPCPHHEAPADMWRRIALFLFEAGMLKNTPRSGWQFLGRGRESVADHSHRTTVIAFSLARMSEDVDVLRCVLMALFHDLPEARISDLNYMNQKYVQADESRAVTDMVENLPFGNEIRDLIQEFRAQETPCAILARDADHLEMILQLKEHHDHGNPQAMAWLDSALKRLKTDVAKTCAKEIMKTRASDWWFDRDSTWWIHGGKV